MKEEEILDAPPIQKLPPKKYPDAIDVILASLFITIPLLIIKVVDVPERWLLPIQYLSIFAALYFFIKKTNLNPDNISFSIWGVFVVFLGFVLSLIGNYFIVGESMFSTPGELIFYSLGILFKSLFIGYPIYIGIFIWIKKNNWAMLLLMMFVSLIFLSMLSPSFFQ